MSETNGVTFEDALRKTGFGLYSYLLIGAIGVNTVAYVCLAYSSTILLPASACELQTTGSQKGFLAAGPVIGLILGSGIWGVLADVFGRRRTLLISCLLAAFVNALASFSVNWIMLLCLQFLTALLTSGQYSQSMAMVSESVPQGKRNMTVLLVVSISLLSQGIMAVLAIPIIPMTFSYHIPMLDIRWNSWRTLLVVYSLPSLVAAAWMYTLEESPKFAFAKGREQESLKILSNIHRINHRWSNKQFEVKKILEEAVQNGPRPIKEQIFPLFKMPLLKNTVIMTLLLVFQQVTSFMIWLPTITNNVMKILKSGERTDLTLCGALNSNNTSEQELDSSSCSLDVNAMFILFAIGVFLATFNFITNFAINKVGRRNMVITVTSICGLCGIAVNLVPNIIASGILFIIFLLGMTIVGIYLAIAVDLFPTYLRVFAVSFILTGGRLSTIISVQTLNYMLGNHCETGFYVFSSIYAASALLACFLADDRKTANNTL